MKVCTEPDCEHTGKPQLLNNFRNRKASKDGLDYWCKDCRRIIDAIYRKTPARKEALEKFAKTKKHRVSNRRYQKTEKGRAAQRRYNQSDKGKANAHRRWKKIQSEYDLHRKAINARIAVYKAVQSGKTLHISTQTCIECNEQAEHYHHYLGYDKEHQLDVEPVCAKCHKVAHS